MKKSLLLLTMLCVATPALAQGVPSWTVGEEAGNWQALVGKPDAVIVRSVPSEATLYLYTDGQKITVGVHLNNPVATGIITVGFSGDNFIDLGAREHSSMTVGDFSRTLTSSELPKFLHWLTSEKFATVQVDAQKYSISLSGSTPTIETLAFFAREHDWSLPAPFRPGAPVTAASLSSSPPLDQGQDDPGMGASSPALAPPQNAIAGAETADQSMSSAHMDEKQALFQCAYSNAKKYHVQGDVTAVGSMISLCEKERRAYLSVCLKSTSEDACDTASRLTVADGIIRDN